MKRICALAFTALIFTTASPAKAGSDDLMSMYKGYAADTLSDISTPHRSATELGNWLSDAVADALNFVPRDAGRKLTVIKPKFTEQGYRTYLAFIGQLGLGDALQAQTLSTTTIVTSTPLLIGQGANGGRYAWAFEMPVTVTVAKPGEAQPTSIATTLRIQIGRAAAAPDSTGVMIENWQEFKESGAPQGGAQTSGKPAGAP